MSIELGKYVGVWHGTDGTMWDSDPEDGRYEASFGLNGDDSYWVGRSMRGRNEAMVHVGTVEEARELAWQWVNQPWPERKPSSGSIKCGWCRRRLIFSERYPGGYCLCSGWRRFQGVMP